MEAALLTTPKPLARAASADVDMQGLPKKSRGFLENQGPQEKLENQGPGSEKPWVWQEKSKGFLENQGPGSEGPGACQEKSKGFWENQGPVSDMPEALQQKSEGFLENQGSGSEMPAPWQDDEHLYVATQHDEGPSTPIVPSLQDTKAPRPKLGTPTLSPDAIRSRSKRIFTPRANGSLKVSREIFDEWHRKGQERKNLEMIFQQCGYDPD